MEEPVRARKVLPRELVGAGRWAILAGLAYLYQRRYFGMRRRGR